MKFVLINPRSDYLENDAAYPPTGLMHVGREIEDRGHEVQLIDMSGNNDEKIPSADIYGITCVTPNFTAVKKIIATLNPETPVVVGGAHATFLPLDALCKV